MLSTFSSQFPLRYIKHGSSGSVFLSAASYCIWQVEISYPTSLPRNPIDQYHSEVSLCLLHPSIANTVISKKSYFRLNIWWDVIYVQREQQGTKNGTLGDTRQNRSPVRFYSIYNNSLLSEAKKRIYPFQCLATDSIAKQFAFKFMRGCIKCLFWRKTRETYKIYETQKGWFLPHKWTEHVEKHWFQVMLRISH